MGFRHLVHSISSWPYGIDMPCLETLGKHPTFIVSLSVELPFLTFHISVLTCVLRQRRESASPFRSGFFTIYAIQSFAEISCFLLVSTAIVGDPKHGRLRAGFPYCKKSP